jgi:uncharacterized protein (TIGR00369 family)
MGSMEWAPERCTAAAVCAFLNLPPRAGTATIGSKTNFFRAVREGRVYASSRPLHVGHSVIVVQTDLTDKRSRPVGHTTQTQAILPARAGP